jgi:hypothetical protein
MVNKVILNQNLNAGLKILPQERQATEFKLTTLRGWLLDQMADLLQQNGNLDGR